MQTQPITQPAPLLTSQVAKRCGVSPDTVRFWERTGRLAAVRTEGGVRGGVRLFDPSLVDELVRAREAAAGERAA